MDIICAVVESYLSNRGIGMNRMYLLAKQLVGNTTRHALAVTAAVPYAVLRVLRLVLGELPVELIISASILEWAVGFLGLLFILRGQLNKHTENDDASVS